MDKQKIIFVVDDNETNLAAAKETLKDQYRVLNLPSAAGMFELLEKITPDLILLDIEMPEMDGFEAIQCLKKNPSHVNIPVIFLTSTYDPAVEARGFQLGAVDFITKPFSAAVLLNRLKTHLEIDSLIRKRTAKLQKLQNATVFVLADMVENRDKITGGHIARTTTYVNILIDAMLSRGMYADELSQIDKFLFISSARLHDVGKITISDLVLNKPGKLTDEEFALMKTHSKEGERIVEQIIYLSEDNEEEETFLHNAKQFAGYHHERWDGKGYPYGAAGTDIPIQGRVMAFADVYDALVSERPYKKGFTHEEAVKIIMEGAGIQFDPDIAKLFLEIQEVIKCSRLELTDECPKACIHTNMPFKGELCYKVVRESI